MTRVALLAPSITGRSIARFHPIKRTNALVQQELAIGSGWVGNAMRPAWRKSIIVPPPSGLVRPTTLVRFETKLRDSCRKLFESLTCQLMLNVEAFP